MIVTAHYEFKTKQDEPGLCSSSSILYVTSSTDAAVTDFARWWANRHEVSPDYFHILLAVKFTQIRPQCVDSKGYLPSDHFLHFGEWKCDFPWPLTARSKTGTL